MTALSLTNVMLMKYFANVLTKILINLIANFLGKDFSNSPLPYRR